MKNLRFAPAALLLAGFIGVFFAACAFGAAFQRVPNTTIVMPPVLPTYGYSTTNAFGALDFLDPVCIATPPGETNRLFVVERGGTIAVITNLAAPNRTVFLSIPGEVIYPTEEEGLLAMAFHPGFATNGYFYVWYTGPATNSGVYGTNDILSRFQVSALNTNYASPSTELRIISQYDRGQFHNAGCLAFGPSDGYLYVSLGDENCCDDYLGNAQLIDHNFFSGIIRIDVDKKPGNLQPNPSAYIPGTNYLVPADNPFVGATTFNGTNINTSTLRTEFWAVGLRNPWRFSFDSATGLLYCGDVGESTMEEVDIITKGGNYGWAWREGTIAGPIAQPTNVSSASLINPILAYNHGTATNKGDAVIGGLVYRGTQISQLVGYYIFGDNVGGNLWAFYYNGTNVTNWQVIANNIGLSSFGTDPRNGDILYAARGPEGSTTNTQPLQRIVYSTNFTGTPLPSLLSATSVFSSTTTLTPNAGVVPYSINVPFWSDNAIKSRWISVPKTNLTITFNSNMPWSFPTSTVWIKHFDLQTNSSPPMTTRVETRVLVRNSNGVYGVTYRWNGSTSDAALVPDGGMDDTFVINNGGVITNQDWHYPARSECLSCHTSLGGFTLGFNSAQLNCAFTYTNGITTNQIQAFSDAGYFSAPISNLNLLPALVSATNNAVSLDYRVRSYLAANCSQCHQPGGSAYALWDARISTPGPQCGIINGPLVDNFGNTNNLVVVPGSLSNSVLYTRVANLGTLHMPPLATSVLNTQAIQLLSNWITSALPTYTNYTQWSAAYFGTNTANTGLMQDFDGDGAPNYLEYLTGTDPTNPQSYWTIAITTNGVYNTIYFPQNADRAYQVQRNYSLLNSSGWQPLDLPANAPFFSITNTIGAVSDLATTNAAYYRVQVSEP